MELEQVADMVVFEAVARLGSFTAAARALGVSKSTVSERVARLEARVGAPLLVRTTRVVRLTELGEAFAAGCGRVVAEAEEAGRALGDAGVESVGTLRVSAPQHFGEAFLGPVVAAWLEQHPRARVEVVLTERAVELVEEGVDVAVRIGPLADSSLRARRLGEARSVFVASPAYLARAGCPVGPAALAEHACVVVGGLGVERWPVAEQGRPGAVRVQGRLVVNSLRMGLDAAVAGIGIAWLPTFLVADALEAGLLVEVLADAAPPPYPIHALYPAHRVGSPRVRAFVELLAASAAAGAPWSREAR